MTMKNDENDASKQAGKSTMHNPRPKQYEMLGTGLVGLAKQIQQQAKGFVELREHEALTLASQSIAAIHLEELATKAHMRGLGDSDVLAEQTPPFDL